MKKGKVTVFGLLLVMYFYGAGYCLEGIQTKPKKIIEPKIKFENIKNIRAVRLPQLTEQKEKSVFPSWDPATIGTDPTTLTESAWGTGRISGSKPAFKLGAVRVPNWAPSGIPFFARGSIDSYEYRYINADSPMSAECCVKINDGYVFGGDSFILTDFYIVEYNSVGTYQNSYNERQRFTPPKHLSNEDVIVKIAPSGINWKKDCIYKVHIYLYADASLTEIGSGAVIDGAEIVYVKLDNWK